MLSAQEVYSALRAANKVSAEVKVAVLTVHEQVPEAWRHHFWDVRKAEHQTRQVVILVRG